MTSLLAKRGSWLRALACVSTVCVLPGCGDDDFSGDEETSSSGTSETGSGGDFDDAACSVRLSWEPGAGDLSSFPTMEMATQGASTPTGYEVSLAVADFPALEDYGSYASQVEDAMAALDGFGTTAGVFVGFDGALAGSVPAPSDSADPAALAGFVVMPEGADPYLIPADFELTDEGATLLAHPLFPLPAATEVAFWLKTDFGAPEGDCVGASDGMRGLLSDPSTDDSGEVGQALDALTSLEVIASSSELAVLQTYPVGSVNTVSDAVAQYIAGLPDTDFSLSNHECTPLTGYTRCTSTYTGGNFRDADERIVVDVDDVQPQGSWEITTYAYLPDDGAETWPTIVYGHGLSGDGEQGENLAESAAELGIAVVAIDAVKHGLHPSLEGQTLAGLAALLEFFAADIAAGNIDALVLRDNFRQSTIDKLYLTRVLQAGADLDGDGDADVQTDKLAYHGVSLGGIMGVELLSLTDAYQGGALVMPGGRLTTVMTDPMGSFDDVLSVLIPTDFTDGDTRRLFTMVQTVLDTADPASYAGTVVQSRKSFAPEAPDLIMGAVLGDTTVPNSSNWAVGRALGLDIVPPTLDPVVGMGETAAAPVVGNLAGGEVTAGMLQFDIIESGAAATHNNMSFSEVGLAAWMAFHTSLFEDGQAQIIDPYAELGIDHP